RRGGWRGRRGGADERSARCRPSRGWGPAGRGGLMKGRQRMSSSPSNDALLNELDRVVNDTLSYFDGAGRSSSARVDRWQARDVLMHFLYFHDATAWGIQAAALARPPPPLPPH